MKTISKAIMEYAEGLPEGEVIHAKALLHLGSRAAVDQALSRLVKRGRMWRLCRGFYIRSLEGRFGKYAPPAEWVIESIAKLTGDVVAPHPGAAANRLRLTTQVPMRTIYITSGRSRRLHLRGFLFAELRHAPRWQFATSNQKVAEVLRVAAWRGPEYAAETLRELKKIFSNSDLHEMKAACPKLPQWLAEQVSEFIANG